jgi:hypothetical protein
MPTINQSTLNAGPINGPALASLPDTEELCFSCQADEIQIAGYTVVAWQLPFTQLTVAQLKFDAALLEC